MADITVQLDDALVERLRRLARARSCSLEALIAQVLREQLPADAPEPDANDAAVAADWNQEEAAFLHDMVRALDEVPVGTPLGPSGATEWDKPG